MKIYTCNYLWNKPHQIFIGISKIVIYSRTCPITIFKFWNRPQRRAIFVAVNQFIFRMSQLTQSC